MKRTLQQQAEFEYCSDNERPLIAPSKRARTTKQTTSIQVKRYRCQWEDCNKSYAKPSKLADHVRSHTGERPFCCSEPACNKRFLRKSHLQAHARSHLPKDKRPYICIEPGCTQRFSTNQHLRQHTALHTQPKPYICEHCAEAFHKHHQLKSHVAEVHLKTKPCPCPKPGCQMSFAYQSILDKHIARVHDSTKRYCCDIADCSEKFSKWSLLQAHIKELHKLRCKYCNKAYSDSTALKAHLETHEVPLLVRLRYPCPHCDKKFTKSYSLKRHVSFVHQGIKEFKCEVCLAEFAHKKTLKEHMSRKHDDKEHSNVVEKKEKRKSLTVASRLFDKLLGTGYKDSGRHIVCPNEGCMYRFAREYDLSRHLAAAHMELELPVV